MYVLYIPRRRLQFVCNGISNHNLVTPAPRKKHSVRTSMLVRVEQSYKFTRVPRIFAYRITTKKSTLVGEHTKLYSTRMQKPRNYCQSYHITPLVVYYIQSSSTVKRSTQAII